MRANAAGGASGAPRLISTGSGPANLASFATEHTRRTLSLFALVVPVDVDTQEKLIAEDINLSLTDRDIIDLAAANNLSPPDRQKLLGQEYADYRQNVIGLLGPRDGPQYIALYVADRFSPIVNGFAAQCAAAGEPLTPAAQISVTLNLANNLEDPAYPLPPHILPNGVPYSQQQAFDAAAKVLTPTQLSLFKQLWAGHPYPKVGAR